MEDYRIRHELLIPEEHKSLSELDVELQASAILFHRQLNEAEMRKVAWIIISLKDRTNDEENHINFALGDLLIKTDEWFGKDTGIAWVQELVRMKAYRDHLLALTGATLIQLQVFESQIKVCCAALGLELTLADLFSPDPNRKKRTLGRLIRALQGRIAFDRNFEGRLAAFVEKRNRFAHDFWADVLLKPSDEGIPSVATLEEAGSFITDLLKEATDLQSPFRGLYYTISKAMAERNSWGQFLTSDVFIELAGYEKDFLATLGHKKDKTS